MSDNQIEIAGNTDEHKSEIWNGRWAESAKKRSGRVEWYKLKSLLKSSLTPKLTFLVL